MAGVTSAADPCVNKACCRIGVWHTASGWMNEWRKDEGMKKTLSLHFTGQETESPLFERFIQSPITRRWLLMHFRVQILLGSRWVVLPWLLKVLRLSVGEASYSDVPRWSEQKSLVSIVRWGHGSSWSVLGTSQVKILLLWSNSGRDLPSGYSGFLLRGESGWRRSQCPPLHLFEQPVA